MQHWFREYEETKHLLPPVERAKLAVRMLDLLNKRQRDNAAAGAKTKKHKQGAKILEQLQKLEAGQQGGQ
jgi:hypothetical protein